MNLQLSLKTKWFEMTRDGIKTEDYREITPYWCNRLILWRGSRLDKETLTIFSEFKDIIFDEAILRFISNGIFTIRPFTTTTLTLGYPSASDTSRIIKFEHAGIEIRTGNPEWGAEEGKLYFVIKHGKRI